MSSDATDAVRLRPLAERDLEQLRQWRNDAQNSRYIRKLPHITPEGQKRWFEQMSARTDEVTYAIEYQGALAGSVSLYQIQGDEAEFGRLLVGEPKGCRVGTYATSACLRKAFDDLGLARVNATVTVDNTAALKIYVDQGFRIVSRRHNEDVGADEFVITLDKDRYHALRAARDGKGSE